MHYDCLLGCSLTCTGNVSSPVLFSGAETARDISALWQGDLALFLASFVTKAMPKWSKDKLYVCYTGSVGSTGQNVLLHLRLGVWSLPNWLKHKGSFLINNNFKQKKKTIRTPKSLSFFQLFDNAVKRNKCSQKKYENGKSGNEPYRSTHLP